jgi:hypothetical protein
MNTYAMPIVATMAVSALVVTFPASLAQTIVCSEELSQESLGSRQVTFQNTDDQRDDKSPPLKIKESITVNLNGITIHRDPPSIDATGYVYLSRVANGRPDSLHRLKSLPNAVVTGRYRDESVSSAKQTMIAGFLYADYFYTRKEAVPLVKV